MTGVLLMAYGGPASLADVPSYLNDIRGGRPSTPELVAEIVDRYRQIGGKSPLLEISTQQAQALERRLNAEAGRPAAYDGPVRVYVGMRHWQPRIKDVIRQMAADGVTRLIAVCLAPHYSTMSVGAYFEKVKEGVAEIAEMKHGAGEGSSVAPQVTYVNSWCEEPSLIEAFADRVNDGLAKFPAKTREIVEVIFTAHSLPERILKEGDPYPNELLATVKGVVARLGRDALRWRFAYQSQGRTPEPWLGPTVETALDELATTGVRHVLIAPVGFVADHVEILYDVDIVFRRHAAGLGIHLERIASLNAGPTFIEAMAQVVTKASAKP